MPSITDSKCVLVLGATSGLGRALARSIQALPSKPTVIVTGRRKERLDELAKEKFETIQFDNDTTKDKLKEFVDGVVHKYPDLDGILLCAGIQREVWFGKPESINLDELQSEMNVNYTSIVTMITFFLPHLLKLSSQGRPSFVMPVTSGLSMWPAPWVANYSATKAALHSFCISLKAQMIDTNVHVMEIIPPLVESELHDFEGSTEKLSKVWMPLDTFTEKAMEGLKEGKFQIPVGLEETFDRFEKGKYEQSLGYYRSFLSRK